MKNYLVLFLFLILLTGCTTTFTPTEIQVKITSPTPDTKIDQRVVIFANAEEHPYRIVETKFEYSQDNLNWKEMQGLHLFQDITTFLWETSNLSEGAYSIRVQLKDKKGNMGMAIVKDLFISHEIALQVIPAEPKCSCEYMTIRISGSSNIAFPAIAEYNGSDHYLGPNPPQDTALTSPQHVRYNFEIHAKLTDDSDPAYCGEGQMAKSTFYVADNLEPWNGDRAVDYVPIGPEIDCPYNGADWCFDDYNTSVGNSYKTHSKPNIYWIDAPGQEVFSADYRQVRVSSSTYTHGGYWHKSNFAAKVWSNTGHDDCECLFDTIIEVDSNGRVINSTLIKVGGDADCTVQ